LNSARIFSTSSNLDFADVPELVQLLPKKFTANRKGRSLQYMAWSPQRNCSASSKAVA
jgi:hypothetical protein